MADVKLHASGLQAGSGIPGPPASLEDARGVFLSYWDCANANKHGLMARHPTYDEYAGMLGYAQLCRDCGFELLEDPGTAHLYRWAFAKVFEQYLLRGEPAGGELAELVMGLPDWFRKEKAERGQLPPYKSRNPE